MSVHGKVCIFHSAYRVDREEREYVAGVLLVENHISLNLHKGVAKRRRTRERERGKNARHFLPAQDK